MSNIIFLSPKLGTKEAALRELEALMKDQGLSPTYVGNTLMSDPSFIPRLRKPGSRMTNATLDKVWRFVLEKRGHLDWILEKELER